VRELIVDVDDRRAASPGLVPGPRDAPQCPAQVFPDGDRACRFSGSRTSCPTRSRRRSRR
jgi:hypothetical protein